MDVRLIQQISEAMQAQQDTIERQNQMLAQQEQFISGLQATLTKLSTSETEQIQSLPKLIQQFQDISQQHLMEQKSLQNELNSHAKPLTNLMTQNEILTIELARLLDNLTELSHSLMMLKNYLDPNNKEDNTAKIQAKLEKLMQSQTQIEQSQQAINNLRNKLNI